MTSNTNSPQAPVRSVNNQDYRFAASYLRNRDPHTPNSSNDIKPKEQQGYYPISSLWTNTVNQNVWLLAGITNNLAKWVLISNGGSPPLVKIHTPDGNTVTPDVNGLINFTSSGNTVTITGTNGGLGNQDINFDISGALPAIETLSDDVGTIVTPSANNIQLQGHVNEGSSTKFSTVVAGSHLIKINPMSPARWIVDPLGFNGTHTTITAACASAFSGDTIMVLPGLYIENFSPPNGVNIVAPDADGQDANVIIRGKITFTSGSNAFSGIYFQTNGDFSIAASGSSVLYFINCFFSTNDHTSISSSSVGQIRILNCNGNVGATGISLFSMSAGSMIIENCHFENGGVSTTSSTASGSSSLYLINNFIQFPITTSNTSLIIVENSSFPVTPSTTSITVNGTGGSRIDNSYLAGGTTPALSIGTGASVSVANCVIDSSNTNAITGAGSVKLGAITYISSSITTNTTTQISAPIGFAKVPSGSGTPTKDALSYYEEGTFTPGISFGGGSTGVVYSVQEGKYTVIGNVVLFSIHFDITNIGSSHGNAAITGLPFTVGSISSQTAFLQLDFVTFSANYNAAFLRPITSGTTAELWQTSPSNLAGSHLTDTNFATAISIRTQGFYFM